MNWRQWNKAIHRDLGYLCFGLTIVYVISGVAVNHIDRWNPSYRVEHLHSTLEGQLNATSLDQAFIDSLLARLGESRRFLNSFRPDPQTLQVFVEGNTITVNLVTGEVFQEIVMPRPLLRQVNFLHLNHPKKLWSWFADLYAVSLGLLATTGLFVLQGKKGLSGRGAWLTALGLILPLFFIWLYS
ncbi:MAG: hypothetical protein HGA96_10660 [Desulfobulbaceae bacterium]|nr:hypothetical protein [Desulfobulbaceae bacterium]